jgi:hypothetical protein
MADAGSSSGARPGVARRTARAIAQTWRALDGEQRVAAIGALLLIVSTFGPFSFVEGAIVLIGASVLFLLRRRAQGRDFHLPFGDGAIVATAGAWSAVLILVRLFSRPLGQGLLALVCAAILVAAGARMAARQPAPARDGPERAPRRRRARRPRSRSSAKKLFGDEPPGWTTPPSGDPTAAEPPAWDRRPPPVEPERPAEPEPPARRAVPPATRIARADEDRTERLDDADR